MKWTMSKNYNIKKSKFYSQIGDKIKCNVCPRRCIISEGKRGWCKTRKNISGEMHTITYGNISSIQSRPIEIKPFFHFYPSTSWLTISTWSCNLDCRWCQNHSLSKHTPPEKPKECISPEKIVKMTLNSGDVGICFSFNEPTMLLEYALDVIPLAKKDGLMSIFVSNGFMSEDVVKELITTGIDGINIDIKGSSETYRNYCGGGSDEYVWKVAKIFKDNGVHVEIIFLIVTGANDSLDIIKEVIKKHIEFMDYDTPLHINRYHPAYRYFMEPTPIPLLKRAYDMAMKEGIKYTYIGNIGVPEYESTYCPSCGAMVVGRGTYEVFKWNLNNDNRCFRCGEKILMRGNLSTLSN